MTTISTTVPASAPVAAARTRTTSHVAWRSVLVVLLIAGTAIGLRGWAMNATLATSDQAAMAWMIRYNFGIKWIFAHDYGPVLPVVERTWAEVLNRLHMPVHEAAVRTPVVIASLLQLLVTFGLLRRMSVSRGAAALATLVAGVLPALVTDAHYCWAYATFWLLTGTTALWATLAYFDERRTRWLILAAFSLAAHCLSNCFAFALPITVLVAWWSYSKRLDAQRTPSLLVPWVLGFVVPCVVAIGVIIASWQWTGGGQLGRLLFKHHAGSTGLQWMQFLRLPGMWTTHFGYLFAVPAACGMLYGTLVPGRHRLLAVLGWASLLPLLFFVDWKRVGYPAEYMIEAAYAAGVLGTLLIADVYARATTRRVRIGVACAAAIATAHMGLGSADAGLNDGRWASLTGIRTGWGSVKAETGIKAAGWYVRTQVPAAATVLTTHTNTGMEVPVAEFYLGRRVLADYDLRAEMIPPVISTLKDNIDVLVVEPQWASLTDAMPGFARVATFRHGGSPVRYVYARQALSLPLIDEESTLLNARYDRECQPTRVPQILACSPDFFAALKRYQRLVRELRSH